MSALPEAAAVVKHRGVEVRIYGPLADRKREVYLLTRNNGSRREKKTVKGTLEDARREAKPFAEAVANGDAALRLSPLQNRVFLSAQTAVAPLGRAVDEVCRDASEALRLLPRGVTLREAAAYWAAQHATERSQILPAALVAELFAHLRSKRRSKTTLTTLKPIYKRFSEAFQMPLAQICKADLEKWLASHVGHSARTLLNYRNALVRLFNFAKGRYLPVGTPTAAELLDTPSDDGQTAVEIFRPWELARLLALAPEKIRPCIALGAFAGLRTVELSRLEWSAIHFPDEHPETAPAAAANFPHGFIVVDKAAAKQHRTAARRIIPMQENLLAWLLPYRFRTGRISPRASDAKLSALITATIDRINLAEKKAHRPLISRPKNGLRHSYGTYRLPILTDSAALALEMNNSPREIVESYRELALPRDVEAFWQIAPIVPAAIIQSELFG